jgi:hypothetical protein
MMRKTALLLAATATVALTLGTAGSAAAHDGGPCNESGGPGHSDYAAHHIVAAAHDGALGSGGHKPGTHMGYSACLGVHG